MFPRSERLRRSEDIMAVLRRGKRFSERQFSYYFLAKPGNLSRVAVIVGTKVSKKAVVRNLCKRRIRAALREFSLTAGDHIIQARPGFEELTFAQLQERLRRYLPSAPRTL